MSDQFQKFVSDRDPERSIIKAWFLPLFWLNLFSALLFNSFALGTTVSTILSVVTIPTCGIIGLWLLPLLVCWIPGLRIRFFNIFDYATVSTSDKLEWMFVAILTSVIVTVLI